MAEKNLPSRRDGRDFEKLSQRTSLDQFALSWAKLTAAYPRTDLSAATVAVYHERLKRYDAELIMAAVNLAIDRCTFFPSVAELIENIAAIGARTKAPALPRPSKEEAKAVLEALHESIRDFEVKDLTAKNKRLEDRREELKRQAQALGVKVRK